MNRFRELRISKGMTQEEFRHRFNARFNRTYTAAAISQFENGKRTPEISSLVDFADFYGVSLDYLLGRDSNTPKEALTDEQVTLLNTFEGLNDSGRKDFFNYLDYLLRYKQTGNTNGGVIQNNTFSGNSNFAINGNNFVQSPV